MKENINNPKFCPSCTAKNVCVADKDHDPILGDYDYSKKFQLFLVDLDESRAVIQRPLVFDLLQGSAVLARKSITAHFFFQTLLLSVTLTRPRRVLSMRQTDLSTLD